MTTHVNLLSAWKSVSIDDAKSETKEKNQIERWMKNALAKYYRNIIDMCSKLNDINRILTLFLISSFYSVVTCFIASHCAFTSPFSFTSSLHLRLLFVSLVIKRVHISVVLMCQHRNFLFRFVLHSFSIDNRRVVKPSATTITNANHRIHCMRERV